MALEAARGLWLLLLGAAMGSFLAAFAGRVCRGEDWLRAPSRCDACGTCIGIADLVPIASYLVLGGRCRHCGAAIPRELFAAELAGLLLALAAILVAPGWRAAAGAAWLWLLLGLFLTDRTCLRLPDVLTLPLAALGLGLGIDAAGVGPTLIAAVGGSGALWLLGRAYKWRRGRDGLGLGDVKLMAGIAAAVGPLAVPWVTLIAATAALAGAAITARRAGHDPARPLAFGAALALAGGAVWLALEAS